MKKITALLLILSMNFVVETAGAEIFVNAQGYLGY